MKDIKSIYYYLLENRMGDGMFAKVHRNQPHTERDFIELMCLKNSELDPELVKMVLRTMQETGIDVLKAGFPISINNFMRIYPSIKGSFEDINDGFDRSRHNLTFNCVLASTYIKKAVDGVRIEKIDRPRGTPFINKLENVRTGESELCKHFTNKLVGRYFFYSGYNLYGIELINCRNRSERILIERENLDISNFTNKELSFTVVYNYDLPGWLVDGTDLYITPVYKSIDDDMTDDIEGDFFSGKSFQTKWKVL